MIVIYFIFSKGLVGVLILIIVVVVIADEGFGFGDYLEKVSNKLQRGSWILTICFSHGGQRDSFLRV